MSWRIVFKNYLNPIILVLGCSITLLASDTLSQTKDSFEVVLLDATTIKAEIENRIALHDYAAAVSSILNAIDYFKEEDDQAQVYYYRFVLHRTYLYLGMNQKAISTLENCAVFFKQKGRDLDVVRTHHALAYINKKMGNTDMALYYLGLCDDNNADNFNTFCKNEHQLIDALLYLSRLKSQNNINQIYKYSKEVGNVDLQIKALEVLGEYYYHHSRYKLAESSFKKALDLSRRMKYYDYSRQFSYRLYECSNYSGQYKKASEYLLYFVHVSDTLNQIKNSEHLVSLIGKFEQKELQTEKIDLEKDKRLFELKSRRSNFTLYSLLFSIAAILLAGFFVILFYQQKLETSQIIHTQSEQINNQKIKELENSLHLQSMQSMIDGQESERERIAQDLHDSLGGVLSTIKLRFDKLVHDQKIEEKEAYTKLYKLIDTACDEVRYISNDLKPGSLEKLGLIEAIKDMLNRYKLENGPEIIFQFYGFEEGGSIDSNVALNIYRIIQELVNNCIKHSKAKEIFVQIQKKGNTMTISVEDDGIGFDNDSAIKGMGLENIRSRVNYLRGEFIVESSLGQGSMFLVNLPIR